MALKEYAFMANTREGYEVVKVGFAWLAFFFPLPWALINRLWWPAFFVTVFYFLVVFVFGNAWIMQVIHWGFALFYGFYGNQWIFVKRVQRGYVSLGPIWAGNRSEALIQGVEMLNSETEDLQRNESI